MPVSSMDAIERIARVIAARVVSSNADGDDPSAGDAVDAIWRDYRDDAVSVLRTLREPDPAMAEAGDVAIWERMIEAALAEAERSIGRAPARPATARRAAGRPARAPIGDVEGADRPHPPAAPARRDVLERDPEDRSAAGER